MLPVGRTGIDPWPQLWADLKAARGDTTVQLASGTFAMTLVAGPPGGFNVLALRTARASGDDRAEALRAVVDSSHDAVLSLDVNSLVTAVSARASLVFGYSERALLGRPLSIAIVEQRRGEIDALVRSALDGADVFQHDTQARHRDGRVVDVVVNLAPLRVRDDDAVVGVSAIVQDITGRKRLERELRRLSEKDPLTSLYNRRHFEIELHRATRLAERHGPGGGVILLDVDRFKRVNDTHGHLAGDRLLGTLARALTKSVRDSDVAARLGGDEFAVLLPNTDPEALATVAAKVVSATNSALREWPASVSAGTAWFGPGSIRSPQSVLTAADQELYRAKATCQQG